SELEKLKAEVRRGGAGANIGRFADTHLMQKVVEPCQDLLKVSTDELDARSLDSSRFSQQAHIAMLFIGLAGPLGYGVARGLSRSIYQLSVRVCSVAERLNQEVGSVDIGADGDIQKLDLQLQHVLGRVE